MTSILRKRVRSNFTTLPNAALRDPELSYRAVGILAHILSLKDGSPVSAESLAAAHREGRDAVASALRELTAGGYYRATRQQAARGRWQTIIEVADERGKLLSFPAPDTGSQGSAPNTDFQGSVTDLNPGSPSPGKPTSGDPCSRSSRTTTRTNPLAPDEPARHGDDDRLWRAVTTACGVDDSTPTATERAAWAKAIADLATAGATPELVAERAAGFRRRWPDATLTPTALARRWSESAATTVGPTPSAVDVARGFGTTWARTDCTEADLPPCSTEAERAAMVDAFHVERTRQAERSSA